MNVKVSVIVPVYNTGEYLRPCLNSIKRQTLDSFEVLCIDDGSTDNSSEILKEYCDGDIRFKYFKKENGGLSSARNYGINKAIGKYLYYCDSDDKIEPQTLEELFKRMEMDSLDIMYFGAKTIYESSDLTKKNKLTKDNYIRTHNYPDVYVGIDLLEQLYKNNEYMVSACLQIIRKEYLDRCGVRFENGLLYEDNVYTFKTLFSAQKAGVINDRFYIRRVRKGSITTGNIGFQNFYGYFKGAKYMLEYVKGKELNHNIKMLARKIIQYSMINRSIFIMRSLSYNEKSKIKEMDEEDYRFYKYLMDRPCFVKYKDEYTNLDDDLILHKKSINETIETFILIKAPIIIGRIYTFICQKGFVFTVKKGLDRVVCLMAQCKL